MNLENEFKKKLNDLLSLFSYNELNLLRGSPLYSISSEELKEKLNEFIEKWGPKQ